MMSEFIQKGSSNMEGIAIIGMSGRFPGAKNVDEFWRNLVGSVDAVSHFRAGELEYSVATEADLPQNQKLVRARGVLDAVDQFDAAFFDINPREAEVMDPQHRLFLECAWESIEGAGYEPGEYPGLIGVFAGCSLNSYLLFNLCKDRAFAASFAGNYQVGGYSILLGNGNDFLATRVSYKLNLKGPSMAIQTACSTSLVAICQACTSLLTYQCDMALAGGAAISFPQKRDYFYQEGSLVSGDGICRAFDAAADGTVFGNGVATVFLKRLADAVADGDNVLAVIKGFAVNNDGMSKVSYAAPSVEAQADVIAMAQAAANVDPESISYIEAHGTGTPLGDPIELAALTKAFRDGGAKRNGYCAIGTAKTCVSHLDIAAGATGLIKTILQLQNELIPPLLHFNSPNPKIDFAHSPFYPVTQPTEWKRGEKPRRAGVSAFGVGGTNAHVVVEEAPEIKAGSHSRAQQLLILSAKTETALQKMTENLASHLLAHPEQNLSDVAYTLKMGRKSFDHCRALVVHDIADAVSKLHSGDAKSVFSGKSSQSEPSVVFMFPGQGAQFVEMGRGLYDSEPVFQREVDRCANILKKQLDIDIRTILYPETAGCERAAIQINETAITQPAIFTVEYALARLWLSWGVKPSVIIGHSIGEYAAAVLAETFTLENALALLSSRARLMQALPGGSMLAVRLDGRSVESMLTPGISLAALNGPKLCTVSGPSEALKSFQQELEAKNIASRLLATSHAFHSTMMEPMLPEFTELARQTPWAMPKIPWISTCTGTWITPEDLADPAYWSRQIRHTVRFAEAVELAIKDTSKAILEVGPGQALSQMVHQHPAKPRDLMVCSTLDSNQESDDEPAFMLASLGKLWLAGVKPDWAGFYAHEQRRRVPLPTYPFERKKHWVEPAHEPSTASPIQDAVQPGDYNISTNQLEQVIHDQLRQMTEQLDRLQAK
jgi:phthiocerol/phenolphthiocerol synthesis type-I polyketide synthase E